MVRGPLRNATQHNEDRCNVTTNNTQPRVIVTLDLPKPVLALLALAKAIQAAIAANPGIFKTPVPPLSQLASDLAALDTAQAAIASVKGAVEARNAKRVIVVADLHALRAYVQGLCDADPANAASIAQAAKMSTRPPPKRTKNDVNVKAGPTSGTLAIDGSLLPRRSSQAWEYSTDGGQGRSTSPPAPTLQAKDHDHRARPELRQSSFGIGRSRRRAPPTGARPSRRSWCDAQRTGRVPLRRGTRPWPRHGTWRRYAAGSVQTPAKKRGRSTGRGSGRARKLCRRDGVRSSLVDRRTSARGSSRPA